MYAGHQSPDMTPDSLSGSLCSVPDLGKVLQDSSSMRWVRHTRCNKLLISNTTAGEKNTLLATFCSLSTVAA